MMTIADTVRAALRNAGIDGMPIVQTGDGRVEVYVPRTHGAAVFSAVGAVIDKTGLRALPMVPAYGWFVRRPAGEATP